MQIRLMTTMVLATVSLLAATATLVTGVLEVVGINALIVHFDDCTDSGLRQCRLLFQWRSLETVLISAYVTAPILCLGHVIVAILGLGRPTHSVRPLSKNFPPLSKYLNFKLEKNGRKST